MSRNKHTTNQRTNQSLLILLYNSFKTNLLNRLNTNLNIFGSIQCHNFHNLINTDIRKRSNFFNNKIVNSWNNPPTTFWLQQVPSRIFQRVTSPIRSLNLFSNQTKTMIKILTVRAFFFKEYFHLNFSNKIEKIQSYSIPHKNNNSRVLIPFQKICAPIHPCRTISLKLN